MRRDLERRYGWIVAFLAAIWAVEAVNLLTGYRLNRWFGLDPRDIAHLPGIVAMPFLHGSLAHAASNTAPIAIFGALMAWAAEGRVLRVSVLIVLLGGALTWAFGRDALHVGASGLIFGWFTFLVARGLIDRSPRTIFISAGVAIFYGAMLWGVLPLRAGVSWEAHLFGAIAGVVAAVAVPVHLRR